MNYLLTDQVAIVTGASRGIGESLAIALAEAGADIVAISSSNQIYSLKEKVETVGKKCLVLQYDIGRIESADRIINETVKFFGKVDILVNSAGITRRASVLELIEKDWDDVMNVNVKGAFFLSQAAAKDMLRRKYGKIINVASLLSFQGGILCPSYTASKHAMAGITRAMANELAALGINVNAIAPGYIQTDLTAGLFADPVREAAISARIPAGKWGRPEDLKSAVVFLASAASGYMHGHVLCVDGGWLSR